MEGGNRNIHEEGYERGMVDGSLLPPRLTDMFLSSNEDLLQWWMEEERDGAIAMLCRCASSTLSSYESPHGKEDRMPSSKDAELPSLSDLADGTSSSVSSSQPFFPPIAELFVALLHSARRKSTSFSDPRSTQLYVANVIAPLCSEYLDMIHGEAASLRKRLLARPSTLAGSSAAGAVGGMVSGASVVSGLRSNNNVPSDEDLKRNVLEWMTVITGMHLAAQAVLRSCPERNVGRDDSFKIQRTEGEYQSSSPTFHDVLDRVGKSMERLRDAMVEDFLSAFVETILLERAKFASYMMRTPFMLSVHQESLEEKGGGALTLSPDLNDSFHILSVAVQAIESNFCKLTEMFQGVDNSIDGLHHVPLAAESPVGNNTSNIVDIISYGSGSMHNALAFSVSEKFMEIAVDPQGMTPEIHQGGARQFHYDVTAFARIFEGCAGKSKLDDAAVFERVTAASRLMSLESSQLQILREALLGLVIPNESFFLRRGEDLTHADRLRMEDFYADERLMDEAQSMLGAKGFGSLRLEDAVSIINRRW